MIQPRLQRRDKIQDMDAQESFQHRIAIQDQRPTSFPINQEQLEIHWETNGAMESCSCVVKNECTFEPK